MTQPSKLSELYKKLFQENMEVDESNPAFFKSLFIKNKHLGLKSTDKSFQYSVALLESWLKIESEKKKENSLLQQIKYWTLIFGGILYSICEGFDGGTAILGIFSLPSIVLFIGGLIFTAMSIGLFFGFDAIEVGKNFGVEKKEIPELVHLCLRELELLNKAYDKILNILESNKKDGIKAKLEEMEEYKALLEMMGSRYSHLRAMQDKLHKAIHDPRIKKWSLAISVVGGTLFFTQGFFEGQTFALKIAIVLFGSSSTLPAFLTVLAFGILIGLAAYGLYWSVQRVGVDGLVYRTFGVHKEEIESFCNENLSQESNKLTFLQKHINKKIEKRSNSKEISEEKNTTNGKQEQSGASRLHSENSIFKHFDAQTSFLPADNTEKQTRHLRRATF